MTTRAAAVSVRVTTPAASSEAVETTVTTRSVVTRTLIVTTTTTAAKMRPLVGVATDQRRARATAVRASARATARVHEAPLTPTLGERLRRAQVRQQMRESRAAAAQSRTRATAMLRTRVLGLLALRATARTQRCERRLLLLGTTQRCATAATEATTCPSRRRLRARSSRASGERTGRSGSRCPSASSRRRTLDSHTLSLRQSASYISTPLIAKCSAPGSDCIVSLRGRRVALSLRFAVLVLRLELVAALVRALAVVVADLLEHLFEERLRDAHERM